MVGARGRAMVEIIISGVTYFVFSVLLSCHLSFMLFVVGSVVREVV